MPTKPKKKSHTGLIISIIAGSLFVLLTAIILLIIFKPWNNNSNDNLTYESRSSRSVQSKQSKKRGNGNIVIDQEFIDNIKDHKYQKLTDTRNAPITNNVSYFDLEVDGTYDMKVPSYWSDDLDSKDDTTTYSGFWPKDKLGYITIRTAVAFEVRYKDEDVNQSDLYDPEDVMDEYIESFGAFGPYETLDKFTKDINGQEYQVAVAKITDLQGDFQYFITYARLLDDGSLDPSCLLAETSILEEEKESDKDKFLKNAYDLENTIGGFDESKAKTNKF